MDRRLPLDDTELRIDVACAPLMFLDQVDPGDDDTIPLRAALSSPTTFPPFGAQYALDLAFVAPIVAG
jgi:hypothetical protein